MARATASQRASLRPSGQDSGLTDWVWRGRSFTARETAERETPAGLAISSSLGGIAQPFFTPWMAPPRVLFQARESGIGLCWAMVAGALSETAYHVSPFLSRSKLDIKKSFRRDRYRRRLPVREVAVMLYAGWLPPAEPFFNLLGQGKRDVFAPGRRNDLDPNG